VIEMLRRMSGKEPDASVSPDEAVAHGAALHAGLLLDKFDGRSPTFRIRNVNSHSLGVVATEVKTRRKQNAVLVPRNTPLPTTVKRTFRTQKAGQKSVLVQIVEGESPAADDCVQIGKCVVRNLPESMPAKSPVEVHFSYEENGRLGVKVHVPGADKQVTYELTRENSLTQEQLDYWRQQVSALPPIHADNESAMPAPAQQ
jgi:molecular chaperone DnaK